MNKLILLGIATTLGAAKLALFPANPPVDLQPTSPGTVQTGHLSISGTATVGLLKSKGTVFGEASSPTGFSYGGYFTAASNQARGFYGFASSPTGLTYGGFFQNASDQGRAVYGLSTSLTGTTYGGYFQVASSDGRGLLGVASSATGPTMGGYFSSVSDQGRGVFGLASSSSGTTYGVYGKSRSASGYGVYSEGNMAATGVISGNGSGLTSVNADTLGGQLPSAFAQLAGQNSWTGVNTFTNAANSFTGTGNGLTNLNASNIGSGTLSASRFPVPLILTGSVPGGDVLSGSNDSTSRGSNGVFGLASATTGFTSGVKGESMSEDGIGVSGQSTAQNMGTGVEGKSSGFNGVGVFGWAEGSGFARGGWFYSFSPEGVGVKAQVFSLTGTNYGVLGQVESPTGFGVYSQGRMGASGTKSFRIDHPFDPENKYLLHYSTEMPEPQNAYNGVVTTDTNGEAWVQLPDYFGEINKDFRYALTVVDDTDSAQFVMAKVAREIRENKFKIRTSVPRVKVSWEVKAIRNDLWVRKYGAPVEVEKEGLEKGKYQHPELYGKPMEMGMDYQPERDALRTNRPPQRK